MSLRAQGLKGGAYLGTREAFGILVRLVGVLLLTRLIGPDNFGVYAGSLAVVTVLATFAQLGTEAYLMRLPADEAHPDRFHEAFTLVALSSVGITALCWVAGLILLSQLDGVSYLWPFLVLTLSIPINTMWAPSQALIERDLRYRQMAILEVGSDVVLYGVALPIAFADGGVWAPVAGWLAAQTWLLFGSAFLARYRPRWRWSGSEVRSMVRWGFPFAAGTWVLTYPTEIVNPIIVGLLLGLSAITVPWDTLVLSVVLYIVIPVIAAQIMRRAVLASGGDAALSATLARLQPLSLIALLATLVLLFGFQGEQILKQPGIIALLAVPILIQVYFNAGFAYLLNRISGEQHCVAGPSALIGASNFFELAVAAAISLFGFESGAALATVVGVLIEVPVMLTVVWIVNGSKDWYERKSPAAAGATGSDRHA